MERTRSQIEELDPLEGQVNRRDIFRKNLQDCSLAKQSVEIENDEESDSDVRSVPTGQFTGYVTSCHIFINIYHSKGAGLWRITRRGWS